MGFNFNFLKTAAKGVGKAAKGTFNFLEDAVVPGQSYHDVMQKEARAKIDQLKQQPGFQQAIQNDPKIKQQVDDYTKTIESSGPTEKIRDLGVATARGIARAPETIARSYSQAVTSPARRSIAETLSSLDKMDTTGWPVDKLAEFNRKKDELKRQVSDQSFASGTNTGLRAAVYGKEPLQTYQDRYQGNQEVLKGSRFRDSATPLAFIGGLLTAAGDLTPTGGAKKKVGEELAAKLVKETTEDGVKKLLKDKVAPEIIQRVSGALAKTTDANTVATILKNAGVTPRAAAKNIDGVVSAERTAPQVITRAPTESKDLAGQVSRGKLRPDTEVVPRDSLSLGPGTDGVAPDPAKVRQIVADVKAGKKIDPVVTTNDGKLVNDGQNRLAAFDQLGVKDVPIVREARSAPVTKSEFLPKQDIPVNPAAAPSPLPGQPPAPLPPSTPPGLAQATVPGLQQPKSVIDTVAEKLRGTAAAPGQSPVSGIANLQSKQATINAAERAAQKARAEAAAQGLTGEERLNAIRQSQGGKFEKVDATALQKSIQEVVPEADYAKISDTLVNHPDLNIYEQANAAEAWKGLYRDGKVPTPSESALFDRVLGGDFTAAIEDRVAQVPKGFRQKASEIAGQIASVPKSIMASFDISGGLRQGGVLGSRFPKEFKNALKEQVKYFGSTKKFNEGMQEIAGRVNRPIYDRMKLDLTGVKGLGKTEEQFIGGLAEKTPLLGRGVEASDRAYTGVLTKMRADVADHIVSNLEKAGIDVATMSDKALQDLGRFINTASGRGNLGALEKHATTLQTALFSPRLWKSRLDMLNPAYYANLDPVARKYALQSAASFAGIATAVLGLAAAAGAQVGTDPRSSDFGKIKVGNTRYDILGGFQQNIRVAAQLVTGKKINTANGEVQDLSGGFGKLNRFNILDQFVTNKANPIIGAGRKLLEGKGPTGDAVNPVTTIGGLFVPLSLHEAFTGARESGTKGVAKSLPGILGVGVQDYQINITNKQKEYIDNLKSKGADPATIKASTEFFQTIKKAPTAQKATDEIKKAIEAGDKETALKLANDYNKRYAQTFKGWAERYGKEYGNKDLTDLYNRGKITSADLQRTAGSIQKDKANKAKGVVKL